MKKAPEKLPLSVDQIFKDEIILSEDSKGTEAPEEKEKQLVEMMLLISSRSPYDVCPKDLYQVRAADILNLEELVNALKNSGSGASARAIYDAFCPCVKTLLESKEPAQQKVGRLAAELSKLLDRSETDFASKFGNHALQGLEALAAKAPSEGDGGRHLPDIGRNRMRLQSLFPNQIAKAWHSMPVLIAYAHQHPRAALCFSGGGIRSATFNLGVLQGLAKANLLSEFDFLSTVSGGGYIGSWFTSWCSRVQREIMEAKEARQKEGKTAPREENRISAVEKELTTRRDKPFPGTERDPIAHLRQYSNYLTPRLGILSVDTWTLIGTYLRNLLINWAVFVPALAAIFLIPRLIIPFFRAGQNSPWWNYITLAIGTIGMVTAITYAARHRPGRRLRAKIDLKLDAGAKEFLACCLLPLVIGVVCLSAVWLWMQNADNPLTLLVMPGYPDEKPGFWTFAQFGLMVHVLAWPWYGWADPGYKLKELIFCVLSGFLGGWFLWTGALIPHGPPTSSPWLEVYAILGPAFLFASFLIGGTLFVGGSSRITLDGDREWWARMGAWILITLVAWSGVGLLVFFGPTVLMKLPRLLAAAGGISGVITLILSHSGLTPANKKEAGQLGLTGKSSGVLLAVAAPLFVAVAIAAISLGSTCCLQRLEAGRRLHGPKTLAAEDIKHVERLSFRLAETNLPGSAFLFSNLSHPLRQQLLLLNEGKITSDSVRNPLAAELSAIIQTNNFAQMRFFSRHTGALSLAISTNAAVGRAFTNSARPKIRDSEQLAQLNRLLLGRMYAPDITQRTFDPAMVAHVASGKSLLLFLLGCSLWAVLLSRIINLNNFSLHAVYRNRLIRAYLGASNTSRHPNAFTGFDYSDNLKMQDLPRRPWHIVNMALNLVSGENLAWQQRKAESFTASPLHAGSWRLGYRPVAEYASHRSVIAKTLIPHTRPDGLSVGTAVTISGAAASPNMGYHSSPGLAFLMTLFNIRLGAWLGNPGFAGNHTYRYKGPRWGLAQLLNEAAGRTTNTSAYVYLSDGGHFENLGLYEMVLRRCRYIVVSDAGCDPDCGLEDLGNAIRKIRIDLGIPIEIKTFKVLPSDKNEVGKYCAIGTIKYAAIDPEAKGSSGRREIEGVLLYIKPAFGGDEPKDVMNYKRSSKLFPHEPTSDQWFSESQFESYRALGEHIIDSICGKPDNKVADLPDFVQRARNYVAPITCTSSSTQLRINDKASIAVTPDSAVTRADFEKKDVAAVECTGRPITQISITARTRGSAQLRLQNDDGAISTVEFEVTGEVEAQSNDTLTGK